MANLSVQPEKERKAKASSSSSFLGFYASVPVPLCQFPSPVGTNVVMTTLLSAACAVTFSAALPIISAAHYVLLYDVMPLEPSCKHHMEDSTSSAEGLEMLVGFEKVWVACKCLSE